MKSVASQHIDVLERWAKDKARNAAQAAELTAVISFILGQQEIIEKQQEQLNIVPTEPEPLTENIQQAPLDPLPTHVGSLSTDEYVQEVQPVVGDEP